MKNNRSLKMIAWIMTAVMLLCTMPIAAMADGVTGTFSLSNIKTGNFILNESADCTVFYTKDNQTFDNLSDADLNQDYVMEIEVSPKGEIPIPNKTMYYELPAEVFSIVAGSNSDVSWKKEGKYLVFDWVTENVKSSFEAKVTVRACKEYDLYNIASFDGKYYRLDRTKITVTKSLDDYIKGKNTGVDNPVDKTEYTAEEYPFGDIVKGGIVYEYRPNDFEPDENTTVCYYKATLLNVTAVRGKIGAMDGSKPRWINGEELYDVPNATNSFHRNYSLTFYKLTGPYEQPLYNFVGDNTNRKYDRKGTYYRLDKTKIVAKDARTYKSGDTVPDNAYQLIPEGDYDFTGAVLNVNGKQYKYSPTEPTGLYEDTFTVELDRILVKDRIHGSADWYKNDAGWVGNAKSTFTQAELNNNNIFGYHRDYYFYRYEGNAYRVDLYDGEEIITSVLVQKNSAADLSNPEKTGYRFIGWKTESGADYDMTTPVKNNIKLIAQWEESNEIVQSVTITSDWPEGKPAFAGTKITLTAHPVGFTEGHYHVQWQRSTDLNEWFDIEDANNITYEYTLDADTVEYSWRVVVEDTD